MFYPFTQRYKCILAYRVVRTDPNRSGHRCIIVPGVNWCSQSSEYVIGSPRMDVKTRENNGVEL